MNDFYKYKGMINDTKQNWINLVGYQQFNYMLEIGELKATGWKKWVVGVFGNANKHR